MRFALRILAFLLFAVTLLLAGAYGYLRQSLPQTEGEIELAGLAAPVEVLRDRHSIPHIYAASLEDVLTPRK